MRGILSHRVARQVRRTSARSASLRVSTLVLALSFTLLALAASSLYAVTEEEMYALWGEAAAQFEVEHDPLPAESEECRWVERVGDRIVQSWPDRRWVSHSFVVVSDPDPGAWSFPISPVHHRVYVTTGLLDFIGERGSDHRDDQLAGVIGHEIAHLMRDHHLLRHRRADMLGLEAPEDLADWPAHVLGKWQKEDEFEADRYGAFYALQAGYRFEGILRFLGQYMRRYGDDRMLDSVGQAGGRAHPSLMARVAELQNERQKIEQAIDLFQYGLHFHRVGAWEAARACFAQVRNTFWLSPSVVHNLACAELKQYETSFPEGPPLEQSISTSYATELGVKGLETGSQRALLAEARADFLKACDLDREGGFAAPRIGLACVYLYEGDDAKARASLQELQTGLDQPEYLNLLGVLAERAGEPSIARRYYSKALGLGPEGDVAEAAVAFDSGWHAYAPALHNLAQLLESGGQKGGAARLYGLYLSLEGTRSSSGKAAQTGLLRCGGDLSEIDERDVVESYRGIDLQSSGTDVAEAALGDPESRQVLVASGAKVIVYEYPSTGVTLLLAPGAAGLPVVTAVALRDPNRERVARVRIGDSAADVVRRLGRPRAVVSSAAGEHWDYASHGLSLDIANGEVQGCLIGGRR